MNWTKDEIDAAVLSALSERGSLQTYVIRNLLDEKGSVFHRAGLETRHVLTACRRLERQGKVQEVWSSYIVMKTWSLADEASA